MTKAPGAKHRLPMKRLLAVAVFCLLTIGALLAVQVVRAKDRILPNISVGGIRLGGLTPGEAKDRLEAALRAFNVQGLAFSHEDASLKITANDRGPDGLWTPLINYDIEGMVGRAFAFGHEGGLVELASANVRALFSEVMLPADVSIDKTGLAKRLTERFGGFETPRHDAGITVVRAKLGPSAAESASGTPKAVPGFEYVINIEPESDGLTFDYGKAISAGSSAVARWQGADIDLQVVRDLPKISTAAAQGVRDAALEILRREPLELGYDDLRWKLEPETIEDSLTLKIRPEGGVYPGLDAGEMETLFDEIAGQIESEPRATRLKIEDDRAVEFEGGQIGKRLDREATLGTIEARLADVETTVVPVTVEITPAPDSDPAAEELGIRELLGYGTSNFSGSPANRRKNIANGAARLNGIIIPPGKEIGLLEYLKPFDASGGYLQELVIKGKRTVPEYGGGLCQIGTTTFRAVMGAGLPITQRQNHSYRVRYYEPVGTDATIYDPAPDFRFVNDTADHVLFVTKLIGKDNLRFEFWGTRDGRVQTQSKVKIWNVTPPPEPNLIETSELPEGTRKCFESPHPGTTTSFTYGITYPDGTTKDKEFRSVYKPWQEQCLVGKAGAPPVVIQRDGSIKQLTPEEYAAKHPAAPPATPPAPTTP
jgi:vancomycin resistance protein YoaR